MLNHTDPILILHFLITFRRACKICRFRNVQPSFSALNPWSALLRTNYFTVPKETQIPTIRKPHLLPIVDRMTTWSTIYSPKSPDKITTSAADTAINSLQQRSNQAQIVFKDINSTNTSPCGKGYAHDTHINLLSKGMHNEVQ